jgi:hypothetical protein
MQRKKILNMVIKEDSSAEENNSIKNEIVKGSFEVIKMAYDDALQPVAKEAGKALGTIGKTVNIVLAPLRGMVWSWEQIEIYISDVVERKIRARKVPVERIITPDPDVAVPALEAMRYSKLRENYANLLATAMDSATAAEAHPSFVEILKQLTSDEAKILEYLPRVELHEPIASLAYQVSLEKGQFNIMRHVGTLGYDAKCKLPEMLPNYVDNLCRLGLTEIPPLTKLAEDWRYDRIRELAIVKKAMIEIPEGSMFIFIPKILGLTVLGKAFRKACIDEAGISKSEGLKSSFAGIKERQE